MIIRGLLLFFLLHGFCNRVEAQFNRSNIGITAALPNFLQFNYQHSISKTFLISAGYSPCAIVFNNSGFLRWPYTQTFTAQASAVFYQSKERKLPLRLLANLGFIYGINYRAMYHSSKRLRDDEDKFFALSPYSVKFDHCFYADFGADLSLNARYSLEMSLRWMVFTNPRWYTNFPNYYRIIPIPFPVFTLKRYFSQGKLKHIEDASGY